MKIWLPYLAASTGTDISTARLAAALRDRDHDVVLSAYAKKWQYFPWGLKAARPPAGCDVIITNTWNGFAFARAGSKHVTIEHHCVLDPAYTPYRNLPQAVYHELMVRRFEKASLRTADAVVAVSRYTAESLHAALGGPRAHVIPHGIETDFFCPGPDPEQQPEDRPARLLFVGNLTRRKGADLLPRIMSSLGPGYELRYTAGLRTRDPFAGAPGMTPLGRLTREELRDEYRRADLLLFPTRFEGFGYAAAEALACGTPVVATHCSALPEVVDDRVTGRLCDIDDVEGFAAAIRDLMNDKAALRDMGRKARAVAMDRFSLREMSLKYCDLLDSLIHNK